MQNKDNSSEYNESPTNFFCYMNYFTRNIFFYNGMISFLVYYFTASMQLWWTNKVSNSLFNFHSSSLTWWWCLPAMMQPSGVLRCALMVEIRTSVWFLALRLWLAGVSCGREMS